MPDVNLAPLDRRSNHSVLDGGNAQRARLAARFQVFRPFVQIPFGSRRKAFDTLSVYPRLRRDDGCFKAGANSGGKQKIDRAVMVKVQAPPAPAEDRRTSAYSMLSASACQLASMMLVLAPTVVHISLPLWKSIRTRVVAPVPEVLFRMRTL